MDKKEINFSVPTRTVYSTPYSVRVQYHIIARQHKLLLLSNTTMSSGKCRRPLFPRIFVLVNKRSRWWRPCLKDFAGRLFSQKYIYI